MFEFTEMFLIPLKKVLKIIVCDCVSYLRLNIFINVSQQRYVPFVFNIFIILSDSHNESA